MAGRATEREDFLWSGQVLKALNARPSHSTPLISAYSSGGPSCHIATAHAA